MHAPRWITLACLFLVVASGCLPWNKKPDDLPDPVSPKNVPTVEQLVAYVNQHADDFQAFHSDKISIDIDTGGILTPSVSGYMYCRRPRDFRLIAKFTGTPQVDFGSNPREFWFWIKQMPDPAVYYCKYEDYQKGNVQLPFPLDPDWVLQCLGMARYDGTHYDIKVEPKTFNLIEQAVVNGQPVKKVTKFYRNTVRPPQPQILAYEMLDGRDQLICRATVVKTAESRVTGRLNDRDGRPVQAGVDYPSKVQFDWPKMQLKMTMDFDRVTINPEIKDDLAARLFTRPEMNGFRAVNLGDRNRSERLSVVRP